LPFGCTLVAKIGFRGQNLPMIGNEIINRPNTLASRIGPRARVFTAALFRAAEQALSEVARLFGVWLQADVQKLEGAISNRNSYFTKHDIVEITGLIRQLKSSANAFGYPTVWRLAQSLENLLSGGGAGSQPEASLVSSHLLAIKAAARAERGTETDPIGLATCEELEALTRSHKADALKAR
jgi:hypothetical protein